MRMTTAREPWDDEDEQETQEQPKPSAREISVDDNAYLTETEDNWRVNWPTMKRVTSFDLEARRKRENFLKHLAECGDPSRAADLAGVGKRALYLARQRIPEFEEMWIMALAVYKEFVAEPKMAKRAIDGVTKSVWYQGNEVGEEQVYDSGLTQFWFKGNMPEKYTERREVRNETNVNVGVAVIPAKAVSADEWEKLSLAREADRIRSKAVDIDVNTDQTNVQKQTVVERK